MKLDSSVLSEAVVEFSCFVGHKTTLPATSVAQLVENGRGMRLRQDIECLTCWEPPNGRRPACHLAAIWWEPPGKEN